MGNAESAPIVVTAAVIERNGKYLVSRRMREDENVWEFPGGKVEQGETLEQSLQREISEELGMDVEAGDEIKVVKASRGDDTLEIHFFECRITAGKPVALGCREFSWLVPKDLLALPFAAADKAMAKQLASKEE